MTCYNNESYNQKRFIFLIGQIPNWEVYLTDKQLECAKLYISNLDNCMVDDKLNLRQGTSYNRLFGSGKSKGAIGKLDEVYTKLEKLGYFKKKEQPNNTKKKNSNKAILSDKTLEKVRDLFKMVTEIEDYGQYLTDSQNEKLYRFLQLRSFKECAKYFDIAETTFKQSILGKDDESGIFGRLKKIYEENHISNWDDI